MINDIKRAYGAITAQNLAPGSPLFTTNSVCNMDELDPEATWVSVDVTGTYTGALTARVSASTLIWTVLGPNPFINSTTGVASATIPSGATGTWLVNVAGYKGFRVSPESAFTGEADVSLYRSVAPFAPGSSASTQWSQSVAVPQSNSDTVIKASQGFLQSVLVTTLGSVAVNIWDNATTHTGTIIGIIPANTPVGTVIQINARAVNGITAQGAASQPNFTAFYA